MNLYAGDEYVGKDWYVGTDGKGYGYGSSLADNSACQQTYVGSDTKCQANFRNLGEVTAGFWYRFYKGPAGTLQWGAQAEFIRKSTWAGTTTNLATTTPKGSETVILTSFRYVLPSPN